MSHRLLHTVPEFHCSKFNEKRNSVQHFAIPVALQELLKFELF